MAIVATWRGKKNDDGNPAEYLHGVPARSLEQDEYDALPQDLQEAVSGSSLYSMRGEAKTAPAHAPAKESAPS